MEIICNKYFLTLGLIILTVLAIKFLKDNNDDIDPYNLG